MDEVEEYKPYEEWWQEKAYCHDFCMNILHNIYTFDKNLSSFPNPKPMTRKEWMETFLLWLEYEK